MKQNGQLKTAAVTVATKSIRSSSSSSSSAAYDYDVLISGGGVVGASLCASLLKSTEATGLKIGIIELRKPKSIHEIQETTKTPAIQVVALSPSSIQFMKDIDAWHLVESRSQSYTNMQVWESGGPGFVKFSAKELGFEELGRICENDTILASLYDVIEKTGAKVDFHYGCTINSLKLEQSFGNKLATVSIADSTNGTIKTFKSRLVIGADGANSLVRKMAGISTWGWTYNHNAIIATVRLESNSNHGLANTTAWQRYLPTGPLALLPLWDGYSSIVWSTSAQESQRLMDLQDDDFLIELKNALCTTPSVTDRWSVFSDVDAAGPANKVMKILKFEGAAVIDTLMSGMRLSDPPRPPPIISSMASKRVRLALALQNASSYTAPNVALVGDAAHSIHPQAGQGLNMGLMDARRLSEVILKGLKTGADIGNDRIFLSREYGNAPRVKNISMMASVDIIDRIYSSDLKSISFLRSLGMLSIQNLGPIKAEMAKFAMGKNKTNSN